MLAGLFAVMTITALAAGACTHADGQPSGGLSSYGILTGHVTRGPISPVRGFGITVPPSVPAVGAELNILNSKGAVVATARTNAEGLYRVEMPPGQYRVERGAGFSGPTKNLPAFVSVSPGNETRFDLLVDTGIR